MIREQFHKVVEEALDSLPEEFRSRIRNVAILVEDVPPDQTSHPKRLLLAVFHGVPLTQKSVFDLRIGPDHIVLYQKNIEAVWSNDDEVREQIRLTIIHELGNYFGMSEDQLDKRTTTTKQPYCFEVNEGELFAFAGIWDEWKNAEGQWIRTYSILTTTPNVVTATVQHHVRVW